MSKDEEKSATALIKMPILVLFRKSANILIRVRLESIDINCMEVTRAPNTMNPSTTLSDRNVFVESPKTIDTVF